MGILGTHDTEIIGKEKVRASHADGYDAAADIDLVAVADIDEEKLRAFGETWDIPSDRQYLGFPFLETMSTNERISSADERWSSIPPYV